MDPQALRRKAAREAARIRERAAAKSGKAGPRAPRPPSVPAARAPGAPVEGAAKAPPASSREARSARVRPPRPGPQSARSAPALPLAPRPELCAGTPRDDMSDVTSIFSSPRTDRSGRAQAEGVSALDLRGAAEQAASKQRELAQREAHARSMKSRDAAERAAAARRAKLAHKPWAPVVADLADKMPETKPAAEIGPARLRPQSPPETPIAGVPSYPESDAPKRSRKAVTPKPSPTPTEGERAGSPPPNMFVRDEGARQVSSMQSSFKSGTGRSTMTRSFPALEVTADTVRRPIRPRQQPYQQVKDDRDWRTSSVMVTLDSAARDAIGADLPRAMARKMFTSSIDLGLPAQQRRQRQRKKQQAAAAAAAPPAGPMMQGSWAPLSQPRNFVVRDA